MQKKIIQTFLVLALLGIIVGLANASDFSTMLKKAEAGDHDAQFSLGLMYYDGLGVPQDYKKALQWFARAADQGNVSAQYNLGLMYYHGDGIPQDYKKAVQWFTRAAEQGHDMAQYNLGFMYEYVAQDYVQAYKWFNLSAAQGNEEARENRKSVLKKMTPDQIAEGQRLSSQAIERMQRK